MNMITVHKSKVVELAQIADPQTISKLAERCSSKPSDFSARWMAGNPDEISRCERVLANQREIVATIPPPERTAELRQQLQAALSVRTPAMVKRQVDILVEARPNAKTTMADLKVYKQAMAFDLVSMGFADAIVAETCTEARRTIKWLPTISEVIEIAERINTKWRWAVYQLGQIDNSRQAAIAFVERNTTELERAKSGEPFPELPRLRTRMMRDEDVRSE